MHLLQPKTRHSITFQNHEFEESIACFIIYLILKGIPDPKKTDIPNLAMQKVYDDEKEG